VQCADAEAIGLVSLMTLYADLGGFDAILGICVRWKELCLADPEAAHPFERALHPQHDERLAAYLAEATGGPALYTGGYGTESSMQRLHAGNGVHPDLDEACLRLFDRAVAESGVRENTGVRLCAYFRAVTEAMRVYSRSEDDVPDGLPIAMA
jgi:hemoglobin